MKQKLAAWLKALIDTKLIQSVQEGLILLIPVLTIGSLTLILMNFPMAPYQDFIANFRGGAVQAILQAVYNGTFGILSVYMTLTVSLCYAQRYLSRSRHIYGASMTALCCFIILCGAFHNVPLTSALGVQSTFAGLFSALLASSLYIRLVQSPRLQFRLYADGTNEEFNDAVTVILPAFLVTAFFGTGNHILVTYFGVDCFQDWFYSGAVALFSHLGPSLASALLFVFLSSFLWFFGIHGSDVLDSVSQTTFAVGIEANALAVAAGNAPTEIFTKTFLDVFVLMGGCGSTFCLLLAILFFSRQRSTKSLSKMAFVPMLFNINELLIFSLPVILNPIFFVPFLLVPIVCTLTSFAAVSLGLVPIATVPTEWTTPVLWGGYVATNSLSGTFLQLFNLILGMYIYRPFLRLFENARNHSMQKNVQELARLIQESESEGTPLEVTKLQTACGSVARMLLSDLKHALEDKKLQLYYQPQHDSADRCIGAEALLRWEHPICGMIYPPLVIHLAQEGDFLRELEFNIFETAAGDISIMDTDKVKPGFKISVNVSTKTLREDSFRDFLGHLLQSHAKLRGVLAIEVTEQMAFNLTPAMEENILRIKSYDVPLIIDDFSMGHTSLRYLQNDLFDMVKLDGAFVKELDTNPRCEEILSSIIGLSHTLGFTVLAECVENREQRDRLLQIGCHQYQGYLYSPALPLDDFMARLGH